MVIIILIDHNEQSQKQSKKTIKKHKQPSKFFQYFIANKFISSLIKRMSNSYHRSSTSQKKPSFLKTMHDGFNYFHQIEFASETKRHNYRIHKPNRFSTSLSEKQDHLSLQLLLKENKQTFEKIKSQMSCVRDVQLNDYLKKSLRYQQILNINENNKQRLPTLNAKIGQVIKKSVTQIIPKDIQYTVINSEHRIEGWKPESREGHTTTIYKNMAVIIGGHCSGPFSMAQVYNLQKNAWIKQFQISTARSYHSAVFYKNRFIIIFGGMGVYNISRKCRSCYNTINLIDLQNWTCRNLKMNNQQGIAQRRHHGAALMGKYMIVFGGINSKRDYLNDFVYLDLKQLRWYQKQYKIQGRQLNQYIQSGLAKHKIISYFKNTHKNFPLYSSQYSDSEGLLFFGGYFGNGQENIVMFMSFNKYNPTIKRVQYTGIPPSSADPVVEKINENTVAILSGELNDRTIKLYKIKQREFIGVYRHIGEEYFGGIGSTLSRYEDQIYIFFGLTDSGYSAKIHSFKIEQKIIQNEVKKKKERTQDLFQKLFVQIDSSKSVSFDY